MIKISVCDDDEGQLTFFKQCFMEYNEKHKEKIEANFYQSVQSLLNEKKFSPDVYFLDIELQDGNGLKLAGKIRTRNSKIPIVFITSHEEFMPEAFHVHAYQYLNEKKNAQAVENVLNQLADYFSEQNQIFSFQTYGEMISLDCRNIICFTSEKRKNIVIAENGEFEYYGKAGQIQGIRRVDPHLRLWFRGRCKEVRGTELLHQRDDHHSARLSVRRQGKRAEIF